MITVMVYVWLIVLGLSLGSFVNALVWRLREQEALLETKPRGIGKKLQKLSITKGRSMCTHCEHVLAPQDLVPVFSWLWLKGRCRYCHKPINDTPFTEITLPILFVLSYWVWPYADSGWGAVTVSIYSIWLLILTCLLALAVYDAKWYILPDKIIVPLTVLSFVLVVLIAYSKEDWMILNNAIIAGLALFGLFYAMFTISNERWIGGGDVKLALSLGLLSGSLLAATVLLFIASVLGTLIALPGIIRRTNTAKTVIPFGPFLIAAAIIVFLWGENIISWYLGTL